MPDDITYYQQAQVDKESSGKNLNKWKTKLYDDGSGLKGSQAGGKGENRQTAAYIHGNYSWDDWKKYGHPLGGDKSYKAWKEQNKHADNYRTDAAYRKEWDSSHGSATDSITKGVTSLGTMAALAYGGNALLGAGGATAAGGTTAGTAATGATTAGAWTPAAGSTITAGEVAGGAAAGTAGSWTPAAGSTVSATDIAGGSSLAGAGGSGGSSSASNVLNTGSNDMIDPFYTNALNLGSGLVSGYLSHDATGNAMDELARQYDQTRADNAPWRKSGRKALKKLDNFKIEDDPIYQNQLGESEKAVSRAMAARGYNDSGNILYDLSNNAVTQAGKYQNDVWNRYANLAGIGQNANNTNALAGANTAQGLAGLEIDRGAGYNNAIQGTLNNYMLDQYIRGGY